MPIKYWIEKDHRRIRAVVSGDFTEEDILQAIENSTKDADFEPGFDVLSDHRDVGEPLNTQQAWQISSCLDSLFRVMAHSRWAVVTNKPASFGMMRMLSVLLEQVPIVLRIFGSLEEAERWLSEPKDIEGQNEQQ